MLGVDHLVASDQMTMGTALDSDDSDSDGGLKLTDIARKKQHNRRRVLSDDSDSDEEVTKNDGPSKSDSDSDDEVSKSDGPAKSDSDSSEVSKNDGPSNSDSDSDEELSKNDGPGKSDSDSEMEDIKNKFTQPKDESSDSSIGRPDDMYVINDSKGKKEKTQKKSKDKPKKEKKKKSKRKPKSDDDSSDDSIGRPDDMFALKKKKSRSDDDDLYSDESGDDDVPRNDSGSDGEERNSPRPEASERCKSKSSKRRSTSPKESKPRKAKKSDRQAIHSESQRIVRESSLRLPYHKPAKLSLDDFFNKKPSTTFLKPVPLRGSLKLHVGASLLSKQPKSTVKPNKLQLNTDTSKTKSPESESLQLPSTPVEDFPIVENWLKNIQPPSKTSDNLDQDLIDPKLGQVEAQKTETNNDNLNGDNSQNSEVVPESCSLHLTGILSQTQDESQTVDIKNDNADGACEQDSEQVKSEVNVLSKDDKLSGDNKVNETNSNSVAKDIEGHDQSNFEKQSTLQENEEQSKKQEIEEQTLDSQNDLTVLKQNNLQTSEVKAEQDNLETSEVKAEQNQTPQTNQLASTPSADQPTESSNKMTSAAKRKQLLLQASLEKFKSFTPRLAGSPEAVIDLDGSGDELEAPAFDPGLKKLMDRFAEHSRKTHIRKKKAGKVEISIVSKEVNEDGKEDLKLDKVTTTLEGEEDEDPSLRVPGAKLLKLKDNLQEKMRRLREEARQKRVELYRLDNEDLFEEGEMDEEGNRKEEAELTDQTDTDYDPDEDNLKDDEEASDEEEDEEEMDDEEEPVRKKFEFGDEEAEVDDDEDEDEEYNSEFEEDGEDIKKVPTKKDDEDDKADMASGEESSDEDEDMGRRKITPTRARRKKKLLVLDEDEEDEEKMVLKIPEDEELEEEEPKTKLKDPFKAPSETSRQSVAGSTASSEAKTSTHTKESTGSVGFNLNGSKTMDMFDSNTNLTSNGDAVSATGESTGFTWSAIKAHKEAENNKDDAISESVPVKLDSASNSLDTSFEMFGSIIQGHQPGGGMRHAGKPTTEDKDTFRPFSKHKLSLLDSQPKSSTFQSSLPSSSKLISELTMPVEDSQDLFRDESPLPSLAVSDSQRESQSFRFSFEEDETQSQFLDENGFLNVRPSVPKPKPSAKKLFTTSNATQNNMDELLGLCSGQFSEGSQAPRASSPRTFGGTGPFSQITKGLGGATQGGMDELLQLCSGTFAKTQAQDKETTSTAKDNKDNEEGSESSFHLISDNEAFKSDQEDDEKDKFKGLSSDEDDKNKQEDDEDAEEKTKKRRRIKMLGDSDEEAAALEPKKKVKKLKTRLSKKERKMLQRDFMENEAELSGSEVDSDEYYDAEELGDELEIDKAAEEEDLGDEEQLKSQLNKIHMKALDDDDARRLRIYKELLLPDGDLHSDSKGRQRQFKWRTINENSMADMFSNNSDGEDGEDDQDDEDTQWRMKRFEREQWLKENKKPAEEEEADDHDDIMPAEEENSQFVKFMKTAAQKKKKMKAPAVPPEADTANKQGPKETEKRVTTPKAVKTRGKFHGSFLHRKQDVAKIAANIIGNPNGPRNSRNFVFQTVSPSSKGDSKPKVKRSTSMAGPNAKRPRLERSQSTASQNSIFSHL